MNNLATTETGFKITVTGLEVYGVPSFEQWMKQGRELWYAKQSIQWCIGDWINFGEKAYGGKYEQALDETDYTLQTLENYAYTCKAILPTARRENVSFSNHSEVASLPDDSREYALDMLESKQWNRAKVRQWKKELKGDTTPDEQIITLKYRAHTIKDGILTVSFVAPVDVWHIVGYKAIVSTPKAERKEGVA